MNRGKSRLAVVLLAVFGAVSCGGSPSPSYASGRAVVQRDGAAPTTAGASYERASDESFSMAPSSAPPAPAGAPRPGTPAVKPAAAKPTQAPTAAAQARRPLLIYTATLSLAVFEARKSADSVEQLANDLGGYLVERSDLAITIRVPAADFDKALVAVSKIGDELHRQVRAQDITAEFRDLQVRLQSLESVLARLQVLLERAETVKDALEVERELERVTGEIERIKGKLKLYSELLAFSTITVKFQARPVEKVSSEVALPFPWLDELGLSQLLDLGR